MPSGVWSAMMGCEDDLIAGEDGVAGGDWLLGEDIEAGTGEVSRLEGFHEGGVVDQLAASAVDEERAGFHQSTARERR